MQKNHPVLLKSLNIGDKFAKAIKGTIGSHLFEVVKILGDTVAVKAISEGVTIYMSNQQIVYKIWA